MVLASWRPRASRLKLMRPRRLPRDLERHQLTKPRAQVLEHAMKSESVGELRRSSQQKPKVAPERPRPSIRKSGGSC